MAYSHIELQELVAAGPAQRNWKGICIAIFCILFILFSVAMCDIYLSETKKGENVKGRR